MEDLGFKPIGATAKWFNSAYFARDLRTVLIRLVSARSGRKVRFRNLEALDGTPLLDVKSVLNRDTNQRGREHLFRELRLRSGKCPSNAQVIGSCAYGVWAGATP